MRRFLSTFRFKSINNLVWESTAPRIGRKNAVDSIEASRRLGTSSENVEGDSFRRNLGGEGYGRRGPITRPMQKEIVNALCANEGDKASCLLTELLRGSQDLQSGDFIYILEHCARKPNPVFAMETWSLMKEKKVALNDRCLFLIIQALCKGGYLEKAFDFARVLQINSDISPTLPVYNILLQACAQTHSLDSAYDCLHSMEQQAVGKSEITYAVLLKLAVLKQDLSEVHKIWEEVMKSYNMSTIMLRKFIESFTMLKDLDSAYEALQLMVDEAFKCNSPFAKTAEGKWHQRRLDIPIPCHKLTWDSYWKDNYTPLQLPSKLYKEDDSNKNQYQYQINFGTDAKDAQKPFSVAVMKFLRWSFNDVIHASAGMKNVALAEQLILQMQRLGIRPSSGTYDGYIRALVSVKGFRDGMEVLNAMRHKKLIPHDSTLATLSIRCSQASELDLAENLLDQIPNCPNAYPYNALLEACDTTDQLERAVRVLTKMKRLNVPPNIRTYELLFKLFANVNAPYEDGNMLSQVESDKRIKAIQMDMTKNGIQHSDVSIQNWLKALGMEGMVKELVEYIDDAQNQLFLRSSYDKTAIYDTVLHSLVKAKETCMAIDKFKSMISRGIPPKETTYNIMIDCCSIIKCYQSACALVSLMIRSGLCLSRVTYTALIKVLLEFEDFDEALKLLEHGSSEGIRPDVVSYNTILQAANLQGRIDVIELIVEQMHQEKIKPDTSTCVHVFSAYVDNGFDNTAMEALQVLSMRMISEEDDGLEEAKLKYGNLIFDEDSGVESQIIEGFKESPNLAMALLHLRWCATFAFPILWSRDQSPWAKRLSSNYALRLAGSRN